MPDEDSLRHKYDPLPEDAPRHRKKSKKRHVRSDHKHEYEKVCIDAHMKVHTREGSSHHTTSAFVARCADAYRTSGFGRACASQQTVCHCMRLKTFFNS